MDKVPRIRIENRSLIIKTSPGWSSFLKLSSELFQHKHFSFGGTVFSEVDAAFVASFVRTQQPFESPISVFTDLGWNDVLEFYRAENSHIENCRRSETDGIEQKYKKPSSEASKPDKSITLMKSPRDISDFKDAILASKEIHDLVKKEFEEESDEKWAAFQRGEDLDELYMTISDNGTHGCESVGGFKGVAPYNDTFSIDIWRIGPLFFVTALEFDDLAYFESLEEAEKCALSEFFSFIDALNERKNGG